MPHKTIAAPDIDIPPELRDGYEVLRAALARGLNVTLLPRQVMIVETPGPNPTQRSFIHGIPEASSLAGVTYAQDRRMRRALLARNGFTVPKGATFSIGRSVGAARRYAQRLGYPVVAKPALGDNTIEVFSPINDEKELNRAIAHFRQPPDTRPGNTKAAYSLTELREPAMRNGKLTAPLGYRFLIEEYVKGDYVRLLVLNGEVRHALLCPVGPWETAPDKVSDVSETVHTSIKALAVRATRTMAALPLAVIDLVVPDYTTNTEPSRGAIVEFSERPWLSVHSKDAPTTPSDIANDILVLGMRPYRLGDESAHINVDVRISGAVRPNDLKAEIYRLARRLRIVPTLKVDPSTGVIEGAFQAPPAAVAQVNELLMAGYSATNRPMLIECRNHSTSSQPGPPNHDK